MSDTEPGDSPHILVWLTDLHCGSTLAIWPPGMVGSDDTPKPQNPLQQEFWGMWLETWQRFHDWRQGRPFTLVLGGDLIEGVHHKTTQIMDADPGFHVDAATTMLLPVAEHASSVYVIKGTEVHVGSKERTIGYVLGAERHPDTHDYSAHEWHLEVNGTYVLCVHHMPATSRKYLESSALGIMLGNVQLNHARLGRRVPQVLLMGHRHTPGMYTDGKGMAIAGASWQAKTNHGHKVATGSLPQYGFTVLEFLSPGAVPVCHHEFLFEPQVSTVVEVQ